MVHDAGLKLEEKFQGLAQAQSTNKLAGLSPYFREEIHLEKALKTKYIENNKLETVFILGKAIGKRRSYVQLVRRVNIRKRQARIDPANT